MDVCMHIVTGPSTHMRMDVSKFAFVHVSYACMHV